MKKCPNCNAQMEDHASFCLLCMTSLDEKEQIQPPVRKTRRWSLVLIGCLVLCAAAILLFTLRKSPPQAADRPEPTTEPATSAPETTTTEAPTDEGPTDEGPTDEDHEGLTQTIDGVCYTFRPATAEDHPTAISLHNYFVLIQVEGVPSDGVYRVPTFLDEDMSLLVTAVADGAFDGTDAQVIDLGRNVRYVWGNGFGGASLTDLYLHSDVFIESTAFSGCTQALVIHCPSYLENTEGMLWSELADDYGFQWQDEFL